MNIHIGNATHKSPWCHEIRSLFTLAHIAGVPFVCFFVQLIQIQIQIQILILIQVLILMLIT